MVKIEPITERHHNGYYELSQRNIDRLADFFPITIEKTETLEKSLESIKLYQVLARKNDLHILVVTADIDATFTIGLIIVKNIDKKANKCEIVYFIDREQENKGYTTAALGQSLGWIFENMDINKVYCRVAIDNIPANRVALKNNFQLEGVMKEDFRISDGSLIDLNYYGLLRRDFHS